MLRHEDGVKLTQKGSREPVARRPEIDGLKRPLLAHKCECNVKRKKKKERKPRIDSHVRELVDCKDRSHAWSVSHFELGGVKSVNSETQSQARRLPLSPIQPRRC